MLKKPHFLISVLILFQSCASQEKLVSGEKDLTRTENLQYYLSYPAGYDTDEERDFGLLLFLHGGGESGEALTELKKIWVVRDCVINMISTLNPTSSELSIG